jgi:hypothetical protein
MVRVPELAQPIQNWLKKSNGFQKPGAILQKPP